MHMVGYTLIRRNLRYDSALHDLVFLLSTQNLRIDKNYTLSIFILSGSIQFYSIFNLTWHAFKIKPCLLYQHTLMLFNFACFHFYNSFIIS